MFMFTKLSLVVKDLTAFKNGVATTLLPNDGSRRDSPPGPVDATLLVRTGRDVTTMKTILRLSYLYL